MDVEKELTELIHREIAANGPMPFVRFMELALYAPNLGYYTASLPKLGRSGDFITAPEYSRLFSKATARQCAQIVELTAGSILELGAGSGIMAVAILSELELLSALPQQYFIYEISPTLKERQRQRIAQELPAHLSERVVWIDSLPSKMSGLIIANEVIDAFPVHRFHYEHGHYQEFYVQSINNAFSWYLAEPSQQLHNYLQQCNLVLADDYESECNLFVTDWLQQLSQLLDTGSVLVLDYGFPRSEYYHPDRTRGTLMCHYQHKAYTDPLVRVGKQDITTHVDFTQVAEIGTAAGLKLAGYTNQAGFLLSCGIIDLLQDLNPQDENYLQLCNEIKILTSPNEMGELFKVMAFNKNHDENLIGFSLRNMNQYL